jgi:hypothetical protein
MPTSTEVAIATTTLSSAASTITFSSIPGTYTDLRLVLTGYTSPAADPVVRFNSDSGSNYSQTIIKGNGSTALSTRYTNRTGIEYSYSDVGPYTQPSLTLIDIFSYTGSTNKTALFDLSADANGSQGLTRTVGLWRNTSAITRIDIVSATWVAGTTATLYGIL